MLQSREQGKHRMTHEDVFWFELTDLGHQLHDCVYSSDIVSDVCVY